MLDYPAIAALQAVIETQGFENAAQKLCLTQSAISQRIKGLENYYGKPVLIRTTPYTATPLGQSLLGHYNRLLLLEDTLNKELTAELQSTKISIAISRDSLETWFVLIMDKLNDLLPINLEIIADDQEITQDYLRKGLVSACASTSSQAITGCQSQFLGYFDYVLVASPVFIKKYFPNQKNIKQKLLQAPSVIFDNKDYLHARYLKHFFDITDIELNHHVIPSVAGFAQFAINGYAYALIPAIDIATELKQKKLINLFPDKIWQMPVYWHSWAIENKNYKLFNELVLKIGRNILRYP